ncbi:MAG: FHA domain-containing protein [Planctomycetaceae bacterium]
MSFSGQIYPDDTVGYFRIATASGRQPIEPISEGRFLIGRGLNCHLRFGDPAIPEIHTVLHVRRDAVLLETVASEPALLVNGSPETEYRLCDGDLLELGDCRFLFRFAAAEQRITLDEELFATTAGNSTMPVRGSEATAADIVDSIEEQLNMVEDLSDSPSSGMLDLLRAVTSGHRRNQDAAPSANDESQELRQVLTVLQKHHEASRIRMESLTDVLDNVVRQQKLIADTLEVLSARIQAIDSAPPRVQRRAG